jgi:basic amino acid/polyamine antiporter, APA family
MPAEQATSVSVPADRPQAALSLIDCTSIVVGIIIGSAIYKIAPLIAQGAAGPIIAAAAKSAADGQAEFASDPSRNAVCIAAVMGVWIVGGLVALIGAMCYAELATALPAVGGTYVYLSAALGRTVGFAFAWAEFWIVRPGNIGAIAFVLAAYAEQFFPALASSHRWLGAELAAGAVLTLAALNAAGLQAGRRTQNLLTACKVAGLMVIIVVGFTTAAPAGVVTLSAVPRGSLSLAFIQVMFAFGGWADMSFVAAEVRQPERNIFRALLLGTGTVVAIYLLINAAFLHALGLVGVAHSNAIAAEVLSLRLGSYGSRAISLLVVISCLGAINGMLFTGARVFYALGTDHPIFRWLGKWNQRSVPLRSLVLQTLVTLGLVLACREQAGFERLVVFTAPFYWGFIALVGVSLIVLRARGATGIASFRVPFYPLTPALFTLTSCAMVVAGVDYAFHNRSIEAAWAAAVVALGLVVGYLDWRSRHAQWASTLPLAS